MDVRYFIQINENISDNNELNMDAWCTNLVYELNANSNIKVVFKENIARSGAKIGKSCMKSF